jgi:hypothetical protein
MIGQSMPSGCDAIVGTGFSEKMTLKQKDRAE